MSTSRNNTLVLDTSVLPKRPKVSDVKNFMDNKLKLDMTSVKRIQLHNLKNIVRLGMTSLEVAEQVASNHHLKHFMECDGKQATVPVPIYVESAAVDVRAFDLPEDISDETIRTFFSKYGEVITIRNEVWKHFFPGFSNGVKLLKIKLAHPIPSIVTVEGEPTLIEYRNQPKKIKPKALSSQPTTSIKDTSQQQLKATQNVPSSITIIDQQQNSTMPMKETQWPSLSLPTTEQKTKPELLNKRQRSVENEKDESLKKTCAEPKTQDPDDDGCNSMAIKLKQLID